MFRYVLRVETRDEKDHYSPNAASHHSFLRLYAFTTQFVFLLREVSTNHPALKRQDRLGKEPFAGFGTVVEDITESGYTKNQPILLGPF